MTRKPVAAFTPFSTNGALVSWPPHRASTASAIFRQLMIYGGIVVAVVPAVVWLVLVVPGFG
ncbi:hypothetical protein E4N62_03770 [Streptomyces sp. MNU76]|uniref:hypothetical protein n=1 Tax=Streptomyces sp. MNU76 TaxID=2560026 RepID=UPI001E415E96|nr:hypothetical protein [Streptomyces sp. MNU76]MCC9704453.1 hypothetical protein [Streptomyces sp. MNU76]